MSMHDELERLGIHFRQHRYGNHKTTCPQCSHQRRKKRDPCLSVTIRDDGAVWLCHHCGWKGGVSDGEPQRYRRPLGQRARHKPFDAGARRRHLRYHGDAGGG